VVTHLSTFLKSFNPASGQKLGEFEGENFCPRAEAPPHRPETSWAEPRRNFPFLFEFFRGGGAKEKL